MKATVEGLTAEPDGTVVAVPTGTPTAEEAGPDGKGALVGGGRTMTLPPTEVVIGGGMTTTAELTGEPPATAEVGGGSTTTEVLTTGTPLMVVVKGTEVDTGGGRVTTELLTGTPLVDGGGSTIGAVPVEVFLGADVVGVTVPFVTGVVMVQGQLVIVKVVARVTV